MNSADFEWKKKDKTQQLTLIKVNKKLKIKFKKGEYSGDIAFMIEKKNIYTH